MKRLIRLLASVVITLALVWLLLSKVNIADILDVLSKASPANLAICLFFYIMLMVARAWRFRILLNNKIGFMRLFNITMFHNLMNNIVPFRIGELSYIYLIKKAKKKYSHGIASLLVSRIFDLISMAIVLIVALMFSDISIISLPILVFFVLILIFSAFVLVFKNKFVLLLLKKISKAVSKINKGLSKKLDIYSKELIEAFSDIKSKETIFLTFMYSLVIIGFSMSFTYFLASTVGFFLPLPVLVIATTASILTTVLPIYGLGGFGTVEAAWTIVLTYFGYSASVAIIIAFSIHIVQLLFSVILGGIGWLNLKYEEKI